jgi:hypothetical protein
MRGYQRLAVIGVLVLLPAAAYGQGSITGVVKDTSGAVLPGVTVEASSPALIEKARSVVTDGTGQYRIVDLRPGTYSVTFALAGFRVVKRDGIELTGAFAATVNADLMVGSLEETVTVSGESPTVDVQNTARSNVIPTDVIDALPTSRSQYTMAVLLPGATRTGGLQDVGGTRTMQITTFSIHGTRPFDQRLMINGLTSRNFLSSAWASNFVPDMGTAAEVVLDYSSGTADSYAAGLGINVIPKEGGNRFTASIFATGAGGGLQGNNYSEDLRAAGLPSPNKLHRVYDINPAGGGPIIRDKLWFFGSLRWQESSFFQAGAFANKNGGDLSKWTYEPDETQPGLGRLTIHPSGSARITWQATPRNKIGFSYEPQNRHWINALAATFSPEIYPDWQFHREYFASATWTSPVTSRLLLDVRFANHGEGFVDKYPEPGDPYRQAIPVRESTSGFLYRGKGYCCLPVFFGTQDAPLIAQVHANVSYVTGSHALKFGFQNDFGGVIQEQFDNEYGLFYTFTNGVPVSLEQHALPFKQETHVSADMGVYAQDRWTYKRATINAGIRFDFFKNSFPDQHLGPASFVPNRDITIPASDYNSLKDITPRVGAAYDLFGDGRTALKASWGKYVLGVAPLTGNPVSRLSYVARRTWTPRLPPGHPNYYTPQCDLNNPLANGDCGDLSDQNFGQLRPSTVIDPETISGWGNRPWNQEFSVSVQQQILPRVSMDFGYFRRWYGNFTVTDNRAVTASDFTSYSITVPVDPRLPLSGQTIDGLLDQTSKIGQVDNYTTFAKNYGKQIEHWNGFDLTINARPREGVILQGGLSTGRTTTDNCDLRAQLPEITLLPAGVAPRQGAPAATGPTAIPESQCHVDTAFLTQYKFLGTYLVPKIDVQFGVTYQATPGPEIFANATVLPGQTTPQVPLTGGLRLVNVVEPGTEYVEHIKQLDLRFSKILRFGRTRTTLNVDLANLLNANYSQLIVVNYGSRWLAPTSIMDARLVKFGVQFDF